MISTDMKRWAIYGVLGGSLLFNALHIIETDPTDDSIASDEEIEASQELSQDQTPPETPKLASEWKVVRAEVSHSLSRTFAKTGTENSDALSIVFSRLFVWDLNLAKDLQKGDKVEVVYKIGDDGHPEIAAARLQSRRLGRTLTAFRWKAPQDKFSSYWAYDGTESAYRLKNSPISHYEQITSLLKDGRGHKGMDFKAPVGTPSVSPKKGVVTRVNFGNFKYNGNCIEVQFTDGTLAKWLHMEKISVKEGQRVSAGTSIGLTGNTGRSTAPHLHYQLDKGRRNLDPVKYHGVYRRKLNTSAIPDFLRDIGPYINALDSEGIAEL
jgi:murein DD-endopeptidase